MKRFRILLYISVIMVVLAVTFARAFHRVGVAPLPEKIVTGDFNEDGNMDIVVDNAGFAVGSILLGDGAGAFEFIGNIPLDTFPDGMDVGDVNEDGHLDIIVANAFGWNTITLLGNGQGGFSMLEEIWVDSPSDVAIRDINADGHLDLAITGAVVSIFFGSGLGDFSLVNMIPLVATATSTSTVFEDFNKDGNLDFALSLVSSEPKDMVEVYLGDGLGGFVVSDTVQVDDNPSSIVAGDINDDGNMDLAVLGGFPENLDGVFISILLGDGSGGFNALPTNSFGEGGVKGDLAIADLNEDGHLDFVFGSQPLGSESDDVWVLMGDGQGGLGPVVSFPVGLEPTSVVAQDFNNDGHLDIAVTNRSSQSVSVLLGDGSGDFSVSGEFPVINP